MINKAKLKIIVLIILGIVFGLIVYCIFPFVFRFPNVSAPSSAPVPSSSSFSASPFSFGSEIKNFFLKFSPFIPSIFVSPKPASELKDIKKFSSKQEFKEYLSKASKLQEISDFRIGGREKIMFEQSFAPTSLPMKGETIPERVSETNVQVFGIDEPDIVKTDGKEIYFSSEEDYYHQSSIQCERERLEECVKDYRLKQMKTKIVRAFPPADLEIKERIKEGGNLLLIKNILVIFNKDKILGYDISNPQEPVKKWTLKLAENNQLAGARLYKNKIYLVSKTAINVSRPCPIVPLIMEKTALEIKCVDIYHPTVIAPIDTTYIAMLIEPDSGKIEKTISFTGSSDQSVVYMSENGIYITYFYYKDFIKFFSQFFKEKCQDIIPVWAFEKLEKLEKYDISSQAKFIEFQSFLEKIKNSLENEDERMKFENEIANRSADYYKTHLREMETSGIVKISTEDFGLSAHGAVPGFPLNQFALDEYRDNLRIAVTVGERRWGMGNFGFFNRESANDVYVLDKDLKIIGSIKDMGLTEKIYSARFIEDNGYVVTFRQTDPFYVLDLSDPKKPELKGELKIPGYSSYLHPITKDKILGIGMEVRQVKISLFDVEDPAKPSETAKYILDEYWSDILNTHHAFLLDKKHNIFFLPGSKAGYIFSFQDNKLELKRAISGIQAKRALYINDYLYIIGDDKIIVLNEYDWEKVNELEI